MGKPWKKTKEGIELFVKLAPNSSKTQILGSSLDLESRLYLKISVTAIPENNKANLALIEFVSKILRVAKSKITLKSGATKARKVLFLEGVEEKDLMKILVLSK